MQKLGRGALAASQLAGSGMNRLRACEPARRLVGEGQCAAPVGGGKNKPRLSPLPRPGRRQAGPR